jgi:large subunit ribosomal protein L3
MKYILAKKLSMSQTWKEDKVVPVTLVEAGPCFVTQVRTENKDGYSAVQFGFEKLKEKRIKKPNKNAPYRYLREFREKNAKIEEAKLGDAVTVEVFEPGEKVKVSAISKGKGFQGVVKRWGFSGFGKSHGVKHGERAPGSIGSAYPQRVFKGKKMAGRMGGERVTVSNLEIISIDKENNLIALKGAIPGKKGTLVEIRG